MDNIKQKIKQATKLELIEDLKKINTEFMKEIKGQFITRDYYREFGTYSENCYIRYFGSFGYFKEVGLQEVILEPEIIETNIKLAKQKQKYMDTNRIERKAFRDYARLENAIVEYNKELVTLLDTIDLSAFKIKIEKINSSCFGIVQLSDLHLNELIFEKDGLNNIYDFNVASKRLKKYAIRIKKYFKDNDITNIFIGCTGDFINSDRRLDELLNLATNRSKATLLAVYLLEQFICDLLQDFKINIACVTGNESRIQEEGGFTDILVTDNYDFTIFNILKMLFKSNKNIYFIESNYKEVIVNINDFNILLLHGERIKNEKDIQNLIGKYSNRDIKVNFVICGHIHETNIGDYFARSGSLCGGNAFSDKILHRISKASQNIHIVDTNNNIESIKIDLQNVIDIEGYDINKKLLDYNIKNANNMNCNNRIVRAVYN